MASGNSFTPTMVTLAALLIFSYLTCQAADQASWYGEKQRGRTMANGQRFNPDKLTAASWFFDFGTKVVVTHADRSVVVKITDRGPAKRLLNDGRKIDLSRAAFAKLAAPNLGLIGITVKKAMKHGAMRGGRSCKVHSFPDSRPRRAPR